MSKDMPTPAKSSPDPKPAKVGLKRSMFAIPEAGPRQARSAYWVGLLPKCAFHVLHAGGIAFQKYTNPPIGHDQESGLSNRRHMKGDILQLSASEVAKVLERMSKKVIRVVYEPDPDDEKAKNRLPRHQVLNIDTAYYTRDDRDMPMAKFCFMLKVSDITNPLWQSDDKMNPPSVWDMAEEDAPTAQTAG